MRIVIMIMIAVLLATNVKAQQYRVRYDPNSLPELYTTVQFFAAQRVGNVFNKIPVRKYKISTTDGKADKNNVFVFDRNLIYANNGVVNFTLSVDGNEIACPVTLPILKDIRYNLYTDSIKPILNYYVNVEGEFTSGKIFPLTTDFITITADKGEMRGMEWIIPKERNFDRVTFTVRSKFDPSMEKKTTLFIRKFKDPRDAENYRDRTEEEVIKGKSRRK